MALKREQGPQETSDARMILGDGRGTFRYVIFVFRGAIRIAHRDGRAAKSSPAMPTHA
jgi:hypothetical protein